jgi:photosystem II stability/assembly factor-like uncharacterized protein
MKRIYNFVLISGLFCLWSVHALAGEFRETFDNPELPGWELAPTVYVTDGILHVPGPEGVAFYQSAWTDMVLTLRARTIGEGELVVTYGYSGPENNYHVLLGSNYLFVSQVINGIQTELGGLSPTNLAPDEWFSLGVTVSGSNHTISLNGEVVITATVTNPLPAGNIGFKALGEHIVCEFDELTIITSDSVIDSNKQPAYEAAAWVRLGGPPGGLGYDIRMQPDNPDIMYVTDSHAGVHKSIDGGKTWFPANQGILAFSTGRLPIFCLTIDPHDYNDVWAGTQDGGHVYYSEDAGQSWQTRDSGISFEGRSVRGITIDPNNRNVIYAATEVDAFVWLEAEGYEVFDFRLGRVKGEVYKSTDRGQSWTRIWYGDNLARYVWVDPRNSNRVYVSTGIFDRDAANGRVLEGDWGGVGILRSDDGGQTWTVLNEQNGLGGLYVPSLFMHPTNPDILLAAISATAPQPGVFVSYNGGTNWQMVLDAEPWGAEAVEIATGNTNVWYAAGEGRIWRSDDSGTNWEEFPMVTPLHGAGIPIDLQVDPRNAYRIFVNNYGGGNVLSEDGGATWVDASKGYTGIKVGDLAVSPDDPCTVLVGSFRSTDGGQSWTRNYIDAQNYAWYPLSDGGTGVLATAVEGRCWHSTDGGVNWNATWIIDPNDIEAGLVNTEGQGTVLAMAPSDPQVVYMAFYNGGCLEGGLGGVNSCFDRTAGIHRSLDNGHSWEALTQSPFFDKTVMGIAINPTDSAHIFAVTSIGLYESRDGGTSWQQNTGIALDLTGIVPDSLLHQLSTPVFYDVKFDPFDPQTLYVTSLPCGLWISHDGGKTWVQAIAGLDPNEPLYKIITDPNHPGVLYVSSGLTGVFFTRDGGATWQSITEGMTITNVRGMALSHDGSVLYAGTLGAGVFRLGNL